MTPPIDSTLTQIETDYDTTIISARYIGSHAWGLASTTSDYDLGLIYTEHYNPNTITTQQDTLTLNKYETDQLELTAWSLHKFATFLHNSNPTALLYASSPIHYHPEPDAFTDLCTHALSHFNPADAIGAHRGKAKSNYWKYLLPTLIEHTTPSNRPHEPTTYEPAHPTDNGKLTLQPLDDPDADPETIHINQLNSGPWTITKQTPNHNTWKITTPDTNNPTRLRDTDTLTAKHPSSDRTQQLSPSDIAPADAPANDTWDFRWGTTDRTIKRYLYICEALIRADIIACTQTYPPAKFNALLDTYTQIPSETRYTTLDTSHLRDCAQEKRTGNGSRKLSSYPHTELEHGLQSLLDAFTDPDNHQDSPSADKLNRHINRLNQHI